MPALKVLIADDEEHVRESLAAMIRLYSGNTEIVGFSDSVSSTIAAIKEKLPDIVLLDIEMKEGTGFDVLKHFPAPKFKVVFITAYQQYAIQAFRFSALDYILKPVDPDLLSDALNKAADSVDKEKLSLKIDSFIYNMENMPKGSKKIILKTNDKIHVVNTSDILYCEADRNYTNFHLADQSRVLVSNTLGHYEDMLNDYGFLRIHASFIININYIKRYEKGEGGKIVLSNNVSLPVASRKKDQVLRFLAKL